MIIIAFGHRKFTGKDTCANFLATEYRISHPGCNVLKRNFADKLKDIAYQLFAWADMKPREYYDANPYEKEEPLPLIGKSPRTIWIELGNYLRKIYSRVWIDQLLLGTECDLLIISDLRYNNEVNAIKAKGGFIIRVDRPSVEHTDDMADAALKDFPDDQWDAIITNDSTLGVLHKKVIEVVSQLLKKKI